jgi:hypothetical protein
VAEIVRPSGKKRLRQQLAVASRKGVAAALRSRFALRFHTSLLLLWTFSAGLLTTKALYALGMYSMFLRYTIAIVVAYGAFLLGVRIWLAYVGAGGGSGASGGGSNARYTDKKGSGSSSVDLTDFIPSGGRSGGASPVFTGGGGGSAGGGASSSFAGDGASPGNVLAMDAASLSSAGSGSDSSLLADGGSSVGDVVGGIGDIGGDGDGCLIALAIMIVVAIFAFAVGSAFFVISMGPEILIDAAFNAMLAGGLLRAGRQVTDPDWFGSVLKATWIPLAIVLIAAWIFAGAAGAITPNAHTFGEVWHIVWPKLLEAI